MSNKLNNYTNTGTIELAGDAYVQLHDTLIFHKDYNACTIELHTGGYNTVTTRKRMNEALSFYGSPFLGVCQHLGVLYFVSGDNIRTPFKGNRLVYNYKTKKVIAND